MKKGRFGKFVFSPFELFALVFTTLTLGATLGVGIAILFHAPA